MRLRPFVLFVLALAASAAGPLAPARAANRVFSDTEFDEADWTKVVSGYNDSGQSDGFVTHTATGGDPGAYFAVQTLLGPAGAQPASVYAGFMRNGATYDPSTDGAIGTIDWDETAKNFSTGGPGQRAGPALVQGGVLYVGEFTSSPIFVPELVWTVKSRHGLTAADFTIPGTNTHPDFSASGAPITFGFFRANSGLTFQGTTYGPVVGIDNWRIEIDPAPSLVGSDEIRAETSVTRTPLDGADVTATDEEHRAPLHLADQADAASSVLVAQGGSASSEARASYAGGLGARSVVQGAVPAAATFAQTLTTTGRASHRRKIVATAQAPQTTVAIQAANFLEGEFRVRSTIASNPAAPRGSELETTLVAQILLHRTTGTTEVYRGTLTAQFASAGSNPVVIVIGTPQLAGSVSYPSSSPTGAFATVNYVEILGTIATVTAGEEFAVEYVLTTTARATQAAASWMAAADFYDTFVPTISTDTPGATLTDVHGEATGGLEGAALAGRQTLRVAKTVASKRDAAWTLVILGSKWFAEGDGGISARGTLAPKGKSGRVVALSPDAATIADVSERLAAEVRAAGADPGALAVVSKKQPLAKLKYDRTFGRVKLTWKLPLATTGDGPKRRGLWRVVLSGAVGG